MSKVATSGSESVEEDSASVLSIGELVILVCSRWRLILICAVIVLACGLAAFLIVPKKWHATMTVFIGKVAPIVIESPDQLVARVMTPDFRGKVLASATYTDKDVNDSDVRLFKQSLTASVARNSDFVQIEFSGYDREILDKFGAAISKEIEAVHAPIYNAVNKRFERELKDITDKINDLQFERERIEKQIKSLQASGDHQSMSTAVMMSMLSNDTTQAGMLMRTRLDLLRDGSVSVLFPTQISPVVRDERPYFPTLGSFIGLSLAFGLAIGVLLALTTRRK